MNHPSGWRKASELIEAATDKAAEKERDRRMREINSMNEANSKRKEESRSVPTFGEFSKTLWVVYLKNKRVKDSTVDSYGSVLRHHLLPVFEDKPLNEITPAELSIFFDELSRKLSTKFILNIYAQLRVMFEVAVEYDLIDVSPVRRKLHRPRHRAAKKPALSAEQIRAVLDDVPVNWKAFFVYLALTNLRIGELLALQWLNVDWINRRLTVSKSVWRGKLMQSTKTDAELVKHLPEPLFRVLQWHRQTSKHTRIRILSFASWMGVHVIQTSFAIPCFIPPWIEPESSAVFGRMAFTSSGIRREASFTRRPEA